MSKKIKDTVSFVGASFTESLYGLLICALKQAKPQQHLLKLGKIALFTAVFFLAPLDALFANESSNSPWQDGEVMLFELKDSLQGSVVGNAALSISDKTEEDRDLWQIRFQTYLDKPALSVVEVGKEDFLPVSSFYRSSKVGEVEADYEGGGVSVEHRLKQDRNLFRKSERTYDIYQSCYLMRKFPIVEGFQEEVYVVNARSPMKQLPTVMKIVDIRRIKTRFGRVECYRVDVRQKRSRKSFWFGTDENRYLYRIEEESGQVLDLVEVRNSSLSERNLFSSKRFGYEMEMPVDWSAFVRGEDSQSPREHVMFMLPDMDGEFSMIRHQKFGELDAVAEGSLTFLKKNKQNFVLLKDSKKQFVTQGGLKGISFSGQYTEGDERYGNYNAIVSAGDSLIIFTGVAAADIFPGLEGDFDVIVRSMQLSKNEDR